MVTLPFRNAFYLVLGLMILSIPPSIGWAQNRNSKTSAVSSQRRLRSIRLQFYRQLVDREAIDEFDLHRIVDFRAVSRVGEGTVDPVVEVRLALSLEAMADVKLGVGKQAKPATLSQRRRLIRELQLRMKFLKSPSAKGAFNRAIAAWDPERVIVKDRPRVQPFDDLLQALETETNSQIPYGAFDDVIARAPVFRRRIMARAERYPPPPLMPTNIKDFELMASAKLFNIYRTLPPSRKIEMLQWLRPNDWSANLYADFVAEALLDEHPQVRETMVQILKPLGRDAEVASALGQAMWHEVEAFHYVDLIDSILARPKYSVSLFRRCYDMDDPRILAACLRAISRTRLNGVPEQKLVDRLDGDGRSAFVAAKAYDACRRPEGLEALRRLARKAREPEIRVAAFETLGVGSRTPEVQQEVLDHLMKGDEPEVVIEAAHTFLLIAPDDHPSRTKVGAILEQSIQEYAASQLSQILSEQIDAQLSSEDEQAMELERFLSLQNECH